jgi:hypothetical protein
VSAIDDLKNYLAMMDQMRRTHMTPFIAAMPYASIDGYFLVNGHEFHSAPLTKAERALVRRAMSLSGSSFEIKMCYSNSQELVLHDPSNSLEYAEAM